MPSLRRRTTLVVGALLAGAALLACQVLAGLEAPTFVEATEAGPGPDAKVEVDAGPPECLPRPPEPRQSAPAPDVTGATTFAVEYFQVPSTVQPDPARLCPSYAVDLDGVDTCGKVDLPDGGAATAVNACRSRVELCDVAGGGDSVLDQLAKDFVGQEPALENDSNAQLRSGRFGFLIELSSYNWSADDGNVSVALLSSVGVTLPDGGLPLGDGGTAIPPKLDGTDTFVPESSSLSDGQTVFKAAKAYVTGDVLVARFGRGKFGIGGATSSLEATEILLSARIIHDDLGKPIRLDRGRIGVRVPFDTLTTYVAGRLSNGANVCGTKTEDVILRERVKDPICNALDLSSLPGVGDPTSPCKATSFSTAFYAVASSRTKDPVSGPTPPPPPSCPPEIAWPPACD